METLSFESQGGGVKKGWETIQNFFPSSEEREPNRMEFSPAAIKKKFFPSPSCLVFFRFVFLVSCRYFLH